MPGTSPSGPLDASATQRGLVNLLAQTFAGVKTFTSALIASAGIQLGLLFNTNGAGASDVVVKAGTSTADASVNAGAKLLSLRTGLNGGTEVEHAAQVKGALIEAGNVAFGEVVNSRAGVAQGHVGWFAGASEIGIYNANTAAALALNIGTGRSRASGSFTSGGVVTGTGLAISTAPPLNSATGTPGATVTQNADKGRITVPAGATSVTVTNSSASANSFVAVEWESLSGVTHSVSYAAGSFTVTFSAALGSSLTFRYFVLR